MKTNYGRATDNTSLVEIVRGPALIKPGQLVIANMDSVSHYVEILVDDRLTERALLTYSVNGPEGGRTFPLT